MPLNKETKLSQLRKNLSMSGSDAEGALNSVMTIHHNIYISHTHTYIYICVCVCVYVCMYVCKEINR